MEYDEIFPENLQNLNLINYFQYWLSVSDQKSFCNILSTLNLTSLTIDGNLLDEELITALSQPGFKNLKELNLELYVPYRNIRLPFDELGHAVVPINWIGNC